MPKRIDKTLEKQICEEYTKNELSIKEISIKCKVGYSTVWRTVKRYNYLTYRQTGPRKVIKINENYFDTINNENAYWLGFLFADGNIRKGQNNGWVLSLGLSNKDHNHLELFKKCLQSEHEIKIRDHGLSKNKKQLKQSRLRFSRKKIIDDLKKHGMLPQKTERLKIPNIDKKFIWDFIRGFFDGDGCWHLHRKNLVCSFTTASYNFIQDVSKIISKDCNIEYKETKIKKVKNSKAYRLVYEGNIICKKIFDKIYYDNCICLTRKYELSKKVLT